MAADTSSIATLLQQPGIILMYVCIFLFQAARLIKSKKANKRTSRQMNRQTKTNYIYKLLNTIKR